MLRTVGRLVVEPRAALTGERVARSRVLGRPTLVLFALAVVALFGAVLPLLFGGDVRPIEGPQLTVALGTAAISVPRLLGLVVALILLTPFLACLVVTLWVAGASALLDAAGRARRDGLSAAVPDEVRPRRTVAAFRRTYGRLALGFVPGFLAALVTTALLVAVVAIDASVGRATITPVGHPVVAAESLPAVTVATHVVGAGCTLWSGYLWTAAVAVDRDCSRRRAAAVVAPIALVAVWVGGLNGLL